LFESPTLRDRVSQTGAGRIVMLGIAWNIGGQTNRRRPEPGFDFQGGAEVPQ
jgi:hypothetical protein